MASSIQTVNDKDLIHRFLIYGREDGTYFVNNRNFEQELSCHVSSIDRMISSDRGEEVVELIKEVSINGRAPKQTALLYALAICARCNDIRTRNAAYRSLVDVCSIPTHLFQFVRFTTNHNGHRSGGWGRAPRRAFSEWFNQEKFQSNPLKLLRLGTKYRKRHTYSQRDMIRLSHVKPRSNHIEYVVRYLAKGMADVQGDFENCDDGVIQSAKLFILAIEEAKQCTIEHIDRLRILIRQHQLTREHIPTHLLSLPEVWQALVYVMPLHALIRNLGKLSKLKILESNTLEERHVIDRLLETEKLQYAKIHPLTVLTAWNTYKCGHSYNPPQMTWEVNPAISNVLQEAFYNLLKMPERTGKRILIAIDGSRSMLQPVSGMPTVEARGSAVAIALSMARTETRVDFVLVSNRVTQIDIDMHDTLETVSNKFSVQDGTSEHSDVCKPIRWALENRKLYDAIVFFTTSDNTNPEGQFAGQAIRDYRNTSAIYNAKLVIVSMSSSRNFLVNDADINMLNVIGFDTSAMKIIVDFIKRE